MFPNDKSGEIIQADKRMWPEEKGRFANFEIVNKQQIKIK